MSLLILLPAEPVEGNLGRASRYAQDARRDLEARLGRALSEPECVVLEYTALHIVTRPSDDL